MPRVRMVTYNIAHGRGLAPIQGMTSGRRIRATLLKIARLLADLKPDIVALQEIDENSRWAGNFDHLEFLREFGGFEHAVFGINNRRAGLLNLSYGNAILSRHPIVEWENIAFGQRSVGEKGFLFAEIDVDGRRVPVANMHLHYRSKLHRFEQVDRFLAYLHDRQRLRHAHWAVPPIVCGDLNNTHKSSDATATLLSHLHDYGDYTLHPREGRTFPSPLPSRLLDFVFLPPGVTGSESHIVRTFLSDHRPVVVDFELA
ncbi:MAG: endonuclease/exonuclease/phosphatase family protein [Opitutaceae bacterium]